MSKLLLLPGLYSLSQLTDLAVLLIVNGAASTNVRASRLKSTTDALCCMVRDGDQEGEETVR
jgi:hypothetical protein